MEVKTKSPDETIQLAKDILIELNDKHIMLLNGELGVGKTTLVKGIAEALGVPDEITSPTYTLMQVYELTDQDFERLVHVDLYRLEMDLAADDIGVSDYLNDDESLVIIEWPERLKDDWPDGLIIDMEYGEQPDDRIIDYS